MAAPEPLCQTLGVNYRLFSKEENLLLEAELFVCLYKKLKEFFYTQNKNYFYLINCYESQEFTMLEDNFLRYIINDILLTEEYSLEGIACYTQMPMDIICDVVSGKNTTPSLQLSQKIIALHRSVRPSLYKDIMKKLTEKYQELSSGGENNCRYQL